MIKSGRSAAHARPVTCGERPRAAATILILALFLVWALVATVASAQPAFRFELVADIFADGSTVAAVSGDGQSVEVVGAALYEDPGSDQELELPVHWWHVWGDPYWYYRLLPLIEGGMEGSATDLVNFDDAIPDNEIIFGYSTEASGAKRATVWELEGGQASLTALPNLPEGHAHRGIAVDRERGPPLLR